MAIRLDTVDSIPSGFRYALNDLGPLFSGCEYFDEILSDSRAAAIVHALHQYVEEVGVLGFHFTRGFPARLREHGLVACTGSLRREQFMVELGKKFTTEQRERIRWQWCSYFNEAQNAARDRRVFFAGSDNMKIVGNVGYLHQYYGGEAVNMPLTHESDIMAVLKSIGKPLVVSCALDAVDLREPFDNDFGRALVSAFHLTRNSEACWTGFSTFQEKSVRPDQIVDIREILEDGSLARACT